MQTTQVQQKRAVRSDMAVEACIANEEFVCANCGYGAINRDGYAYHIKLCAIPA